MVPSRLAALAVLMVLPIARSAAAQTAPDHRTAVTIAAGYPLTSTTYSQITTFEAYAEEGSIKTDYILGRHPVFDAGVVVRLWRGFGAGVAGSFLLQDSSHAAISGSIPHPLVPNQPRAISGTADIMYRESAVHIQAAYWAQLTGRIDLIISGGPSSMRIEQDFVDDVAYSQTFPYDTATFDSATLVREHKTVIGANVGGEISWRLTRSLAAVGLAQYSRARVEFTDTGISPFTAGGLHFGGGVRLFF
jgi:hypothetical protein